MDTTQVTVTATWAKVIESTATEFTIQNIGVQGVFLNYSTGTPDSAEKGIEITKGKGITSTVFGTGEIWARVSSSSSGVLAVTV